MQFNKLGALMRDTQEKQFDVRTWLIERRSMYHKQEGMPYSQV